MGVFRFKRFDVVNERSAMKVNTDGVLLGAAMTVRSTDRNLLDIGTGTGTIALMAAQRLEGQGTLNIHAVDIDEASATEAGVNFRNSPWADNLTVHHASLDDFALEEAVRKYDLIFSNPPYFEDSLNAPEERRSARRSPGTSRSLR